MGDDERGQVSHSAATVYEEFFVPALFAQWTEAVIAAAEIRAGDRVLDIACGTGVLARAVKEAVGPAGSIVGLDSNPAMLEVARLTAPQIEWRAGRAEAIPFADDEFDAIVSQFGLMFFKDRLVALQEMQRALRPGGMAAVAVWGSINRSPGYAALAELLTSLFGESAAESLRWPFALGDPDAVTALLRDAGFTEPRASTQLGIARFPSMESWIFTEIRGWTLAGSIDDAAFDRLLADASRALPAFVQRDGTVQFDVEAIIASARSPE